MSRLLILLALCSFTTNFARAARPDAINFNRVRAAEFDMGTPLSDKQYYSVAERKHPVKITKDFFLSSTEVSQWNWYRFMGTNPSRFKTKAVCPQEYLVDKQIEICPSHPVESLTIAEVEKFLAVYQKLANRAQQDPKVKIIVRLPTEAEWELAARGNIITPFSFGSDVTLLSHYAWFNGNSGEHTHPIEEKMPDVGGFFDMHGNVAELVTDTYAPYEEKLQTDPKVDVKDGKRILRGGSFADFPAGCRLGSRKTLEAKTDSSTWGFRIVYEIEEK